MRLFRLAYCSRSKKAFSFAELKELIHKAKVNNKEKNVSGILFYTDNYFFQCLEGSQEEINDLYLKIANDARHGAIRLLSYNQVEQRLFSDWGMGLVQTEDTKELVTKHFSKGKFVPNELSPSAVDELLVDLKATYFD